MMHEMCLFFFLDFCEYSGGGQSCQRPRTWLALQLGWKLNINGMFCTMNGIIALLTDFGLEDIYVGVMKGVMLDIYSEARLVDISHAIEPQHVRQGAIALRDAVSYFPEGTVFLVVIDPGVGGDRSPVAVHAGGYAFVGPDNGVLTYALENLDTDLQIVDLVNPEYRLSQVSTTFHGRDIFAPAAAYLARGVPLTHLGPSLDRLVQLPRPELNIAGASVNGEITQIDRFGNITTSIGRLRWVQEDRLLLEPPFEPQRGPLMVSASDAAITLNGQTIHEIRVSYSEALRGDLLALVGSTGYLEVAVNQGNAAQRLEVAVGDRVELIIGDFDAAVRN
jgi:S-adenosyl-L-methionine hydrolase (adenosine-forming)